MRILITNDDGVFAPASPPWPGASTPPSATSTSWWWWPPWPTTAGPGPPWGRVYERESIPYEDVDIPGLAHVPTYGIDGPPALAVILACIEGFGPRPDLVVSGINHGVNAGRSALHSGTVGAALTGAQFGIRGLAVSIAWGDDPGPWETPVGLAVGMVPALAEAAPVDRPQPQRRRRWPPTGSAGLRHGTLGTVGLIRSVRPEHTPEPVAGNPIDTTSGVITLALRGMGVGADRIAEQAELEPDSDAALIAEGWATVTPISGVREDSSAGATDALAAALATHRRAPEGTS